MRNLKINANFTQKVYVDPIEVLEEIYIISKGDWIVEKNGKYIQMCEHSAGQHSFDMEEGEVSERIYEAYKAKNTLIEYLKSLNETNR